jgi:hypothetical protein
LIRLSQFFKSSRASDIVTALLNDFPDDDVAAALRIEEFIRNAAPFGYEVHGKINRPSAALLASVLLTAVFPAKFVDFKMRRWKAFAAGLGYSPFGGIKPSYGEMIVHAGRFAAAVVSTETFRAHWRDGEPLWTLAGICWASQHLIGEPRDAKVHGDGYAEGNPQLRLHFVRERNRKLVSEAKALRLSVDPLLRCDVCQFSFVEHYGEIGQGFIEAHHTQPVSKLAPGCLSRIEDLAFVCSNCHQMIHRDGLCLSIVELRKRLEPTK